MDKSKKRRSKRLPFRKRVRYGNKTSKFMGHTMNLSRHGIVIESSRMFPKGTSLIIEILDNLSDTPNSNGPVKLIGKVVWSSQGIGLSSRGKMGIEFLTQKKEIEQAYDSKILN